MSPARSRRPRGPRADVRDIIAYHFGKPATRIQDCSGGLTNAVFRVAHPEGSLIVRIGADSSRIDHFLKEQWAIARAKAAGAPTPEVLEVAAAAIERPYMISREVRGHPGHERIDREAILRRLGECAAQIHQVRTADYGATFDWSANLLSRNATWKAFLKEELHAWKRLAFLEEKDFLSARIAKALRSTLREFAADATQPTLSHGDLRLKNVLTAKDGSIKAVIDWEDCISAINPAWDLAIALHDLSIDEKEAFLEGYGLDPAALTELAPRLRLLNILHYAPYVQAAIEARDKPRTAWYRARLAGALELFEQ